MRNIIDLFYIGLEYSIEFISALAMIILLGVITIIDFLSLVINSIILRILGVIIVVLLLYTIIH